LLEASDIDIIRECLKGNKEIFSELVTRYKKLIYSVIYNMVEDKEEVNDIAQEVFIRIYKALDRYNPEYKFSTWAVKIATNLCMDIHRKKKINSVPIDDALDVPNNFDTPESKYINMEQARILREAVDSLPEKYRVPVMLFHNNGLSYEEIIKVLNEPMTIIKNRIYRARLMLKEKLMNERKEEVL